MCVGGGGEYDNCSNDGSLLPRGSQAGFGGCRGNHGNRKHSTMSQDSVSYMCLPCLVIADTTCAKNPSREMDSRPSHLSRVKLKNRFPGDTVVINNLPYSSRDNRGAEAIQAWIRAPGGGGGVVLQQADLS